jgi:hypothetical protein
VDQSQENSRSRPLFGRLAGNVRAPTILLTPPALAAFDSAADDQHEPNRIVRPLAHFGCCVDTKFFILRVCSMPIKRLWDLGAQEMAEVSIYIQVYKGQSPRPRLEKNQYQHSSHSNFLALSTFQTLLPIQTPKSLTSPRKTSNHAVHHVHHQQTRYPRTHHIPLPCCSQHREPRPPKTYTSSCHGRSQDLRSNRWIGPHLHWKRSHHMRQRRRKYRDLSRYINHWLPSMHPVWDHPGRYSSRSERGSCLLSGL